MPSTVLEVAVSVSVLVVAIMIKLLSRAGLFTKQPPAPRQRRGVKMGAGELTLPVG